jgi:Na+/melibiose symporter-like transporter
MSFPSLIHTLHLALPVFLIFLGGPYHSSSLPYLFPPTDSPTGLSSCLSLWVIPLTSLLPPKLAARQFTQTFTWGGQYLLPSSRTLGALILLTTMLTSLLPDPDDAATWPIWALLFCMVVTVAPYEIYLIFPLNDRVKEIGSVLEHSTVSEDAVKRELQTLLKTWAFRNWGRILAPVVVGVMGLAYGRK